MFSIWERAFTFTWSSLIWPDVSCQAPSFTCFYLAGTGIASMHPPHLLFCLVCFFMWGLWIRLKSSMSTFCGLCHLSGPKPRVLPLRWVLASLQISFASLTFLPKLLQALSSRSLPHYTLLWNTKANLELTTSTPGLWKPLIPGSCDTMPSHISFWDFLREFSPTHPLHSCLITSLRLHSLSLP